MRRLIFPGLIMAIWMLPMVSMAQIETYWIDTTTHGAHSKAYFFTNRPYTIDKQGRVGFKNKSTKQTDNLFFCLFDYEEDSIYVKYRAKNASDLYPTDKVENNFFYKVYDDVRMKKGIKRISITVPGYSHTFESQVKKFMYRMTNKYSDSVRQKAVLILYAWGDEWRPYRYYRAKKSANRGGDDFAIFQHMLEDFLSDSLFFETHPKDVSFHLTCSSMGNQLLKEYLLEREKQGIPLSKVYKSILLIGSDASWDSFEEGKGLHNLGELCDTVRVLWHDKDLPLRVSKTANMKKRMGLYGPRDPESLPGYIRVYNIGDWLVDEDRSGGWHDYLLSNPEVQKAILEGI